MPSFTTAKSQRTVVWLGDSKQNIRSFPDGAQKLWGDELQLVQFGGMPKDAKPFKGIGSGIVEMLCDMRRTPTESYWRYRSANGSLYYTPFRRNRRKASQPEAGR